MTRVVTALYDTVPQAELALAHLASEVGMEEGEIVDSSIAGRTKLARMNLSPKERAASERAIADGGYLLIARVDKAHDPQRIVTLLKDIPRDGLGRSNEPALASGGEFEGFRVEDPKAAQTGAQGPDDAATSAPAAPAPATRNVGPWEGFRVEDPAQTEQTEAEERIPLVEEELRIGKREVLRGGARVRAHVEERPVQHEVELFEEHVSIERRPATRKLSEEELEAGGLLRDRVIEVSAMREEALVSKGAFVREELVVKKTTERRTKRIDDTIRRTEVETERLGGAEDRPAFGGFGSPGAESRSRK